MVPDPDMRFYDRKWYEYVPYICLVQKQDICKSLNKL